MIENNLFGTSIEDNFFDQNIDIFFQELEMIFQLQIDDVYGSQKVLNLRKYVMQKKISNYQVENEIRNFVMEHCYQSRNFIWSVKVDFIKTESSPNDVMYVQFNIKVGDGVRKRQFVISN